jgi:hypothetical protein
MPKEESQPPRLLATLVRQTVAAQHFSPPRRLPKHPSSTIRLTLRAAALLLQVQLLLQSHHTLFAANTSYSTGSNRTACLARPPAVAHSSTELKLSHSLDFPSFPFPRNKLGFCNCAFPQPSHTTRPQWLRLARETCRTTSCSRLRPKSQTEVAFVPTFCHSQSLTCPSWRYLLSPQIQGASYHGRVWRRIHFAGSVEQGFGRRNQRHLERKY